MPSKYQMIVELESLTAHDITSHPHLYPAFLTTAANNYKYTFREQLLIYAQKPDATACADLETWNKLGRWVNKGTKGIALLVDRDIPYKLRHVFDISNTNSLYGHEVKVWQMKEQHEDAILDALEDSFGELEHRENFAEALIEVAGTVVQDNMPDYLEMLQNAKHGSLLENIHADNWQDCFQNILKNSVAYMTMVRCGYDPEPYFDVGDFSEVVGFDTPQTVNILGCATSEIGEMVLREIEATVRSAERDEKRQNRTFAKTENKEHNNGDKEKAERSNENVTDLHQSGKLRTAEPERSGESEDRKVWNVAAHLPQKAQEERVQRTDAVGQDEQSSGGNRPTGDRDDGIAHEADGTDRASERETQSNRSDEMGSVDEQHPEPSGGNRTDGSGLQLTSSGHDYNGRQEKDYYHSPAEKNELIRNCIALKDHRAEIATFFAEHENRDERGNFIKSFFDGEMVSHTLESGQVVGYRAFDDLIQIWHGEYDTRDKEDFIQWWRLADYINGQMLLDEWLSPDEKPFPSEAEQISFITEQRDKKTNAFVLPQAAIDYVLTRGSGVSEGKYRIQEQFLKKEGKEKNVTFLKNEYGTGGHSDAIPESGLWESHDGKGIEIARNEGNNEKKSYLITWSAAEKRIGELIAADRYLNRAEKEYYPEYARKEMARKERTVISKEFDSIVEDYNDFQKQIGNEGAMLNQYVLKDCSRSFMLGEKRTGFISKDGDFIIPLMREAMEKVLAENTHHKDRAASMLAQLHGVHAQKLEPTYDELNPPPEPEKEYKFSLGDTVFIGAQEYEIISLDGDNVTLFDTEFPLLNKDMPRAEFDAKVKENPLNDKYLQVVEGKIEDAPISPDDDYTRTRIVLNTGDLVVHWMYYNPDADSGGQYVVGDLPFREYKALIESYDIANHPEKADAFRDELEEMSDQYLGDVNTSAFYDAENDYELGYDYLDFTSENILQINNDILAYEAKNADYVAHRNIYDREVEILGDVLDALKMDDVKLHYDPDGIVATDSMGNEWHNKEFYKFLVEEACVFEDDGGMGEAHELFKDFSELSGLMGVPVSDPLVSSWDEYERVKKDNPDAVVMYKVGDFFEIFGERDTQIAHDVLDLMLTKKVFNNKSITTPMCGFPYHVTEQYVQRLLDAGNDVVMVTHEPGEKLVVRKLVSSGEKEQPSTTPVGRIEYLGTDGTVGETIEYTDAERFEKDIKSDNYYGTPMKVVVYRNADGSTIPHDFIFNCDPPLQGFSVEDLPQKPYIDHYYVVEDLRAVPLEIKTFSELDKALNEYFSLPTEKVKAFGVQNTNELPGTLDFIQCKDGVDTLTEDYLKVEERAGWQNDEIIGLENRLKEEIDKHAKPLAPPPAPVKSGKLTPHILYPEIKSDYRTNYRIEDDDIGVGTPLDRFYHNKSAIQLLKKLEDEHRLAQPYEQNMLANYVGWGGLPQFFEETNPHYAELKELLTEDEYASARESTLTAFYTPPVVIKAMYKALENMNFKTGNVLEPSCGIGNFMGLVPDSMSDAKFYGVELDSISGRIAQQLYQKNSIAVQGFEDTKLPDSFFDAAIGNVPFGQFKVPDKRYDKHNFLIHDYFFARTLDKVRPGGVVAFITSSGTMDKENPSVRKYIAQRADLLGAIRLPNNTFKDAAGTEVTADIIFLQKRDRLIDIEPDWVHLGTDENGIKMNSYFVDNPEMIMGEMQMISGPHGPTSACIAYDDADLGEQLNNAIQNIHAEITEVDFDDIVDEEEDLSIPADPDVRNFSYTIVDGKIYYRENSRMMPVDVSATAESRIRGMIEIRDCVRTLIEYQTEDYPDEAIAEQQNKLNELYDKFSKKYGIINSRANNTAFNADSSYCLLSSLEILDDEGQFIRKADMFTKRTIKQKVVVTAVDTASEALALSLAEKARIDIPYMCELTGKTEDEITDDLRGVIFRNPGHLEDSNKPKYLPADEYLSGNVREKLRKAQEYAKLNAEEFEPNVRALEAVIPPDLSASEISVRLGATWLPPEDVEKFMFELFDTVRYMQWNIKVHYSEYTGEWNIEGKSYDRANIKVHNTYGTSRINGYKIIEETLNLRDVRIFDYVEDENGNKKPVLNKKETAIAQGKQQLIKEAFAEWIWKDPERRERLTKLYNEKFNSLRPREYNGEHLNFVGMNPEITLRPHQVNAIAHIIYGGNTLLAHVVGAGKTFEMVAAAQESKRLGLCQKSLFVVPNHLTEQWAAEYLQLYPSANILVATKKDFETKNRKKFCGRIATGDYDAIIIGHSQFEKIPMSIERQRMILEQQLDEIIEGVAELKKNRGDNFSIKQLEKTKKTVKQKLEKLNDQSRKDDVVTFEELGVDRIFIDEAHYYKNLAAFTKMRNVGGISQTEAQKSSDLYMKCRYLDELTGGKGVVFATGTPISNSMVELYTMQKYLQYNTLRRNNLLHFDAWASTFGETVTAIELAPEGSGYRAKTRFAKFYNLPELMAMFKETADIQTADMLHLPVPEAHFHTVALKPSEQQKKMVEALSERAERVRNKRVDSTVDNMLLITNDGRKLALDQRMMNDMLPDSETSKVSACADNVFDIWQRTTEQKSTQMVFCDLSTPHGDDKFNVYDDLRDKLIAKGIPAEEIAYIHSANTEVQKKEMFGKVRSGQIRVLIGSTQKMGAGTNVQKRLIALHHLDCPWRPSDLQQREGRIIRQGNENPEVDIYTYVTENTFDSYLYQLVESKQKFIGQIMTSKSPVRSAEDVDEQALSYAEIKALCTGNPYIKEKMDLDIDVSRLKLLKANHLSQKYSLEDKILKEFPKQITALEERIEGYGVDMQTVSEHPAGDAEHFCGMAVKGKNFAEKKDAGEAIIAACKAMTKPEAQELGSYRGFGMELNFDPCSREYTITLKGKLRHTTALGTDIFGNIQRLDNLLDKMSEKKDKCVEQLGDIQTQLANAKVEVEKPFPHEEEMKTKTERLAELNSLLDMDKKENEIVDGEREDDDDREPERSDSRDAR